jgi:acetyl-CoA synthetase
MASSYHEVYASWKRDPEGFWAEAAGEIDWFSPWDKVFDAGQGVYGRWFVGATCNMCHNALDRHVAGGRAGQTALIHDSPITGTQRSFTYAELLDEVVALAAVISDQGVKKGDRVIIYMPMVPEAAIAMLACARIGAPHSVVFGAFSADSLRDRINDCEAKVLVTADSGPRGGKTTPLKQNADEALEDAPSIESVVVVKRSGDDVDFVEGRDHWWDDLMTDASEECQAEEVDSCPASEASSSETPSRAAADRPRSDGNGHRRAHSSSPVRAIWRISTKVTQNKVRTIVSAIAEPRPYSLRPNDSW